MIWLTLLCVGLLLTTTVDAQSYCCTTTNNYLKAINDVESDTCSCAEESALVSYWSNFIGNTISESQWSQWALVNYSTAGWLQYIAQTSLVGGGILQYTVGESAFDAKNALYTTGVVPARIADVTEQVYHALCSGSCGLGSFSVADELVTSDGTTAAMWLQEIFNILSTSGGGEVTSDEFNFWLSLLATQIGMSQYTTLSGTNQTSADILYQILEAIGGTDSDETYFESWIATQLGTALWAPNPAQANANTTVSGLLADTLMASLGSFDYEWRALSSIMYAGFPCSVGSGATTNMTIAQILANALSA